MATEIWKEFQFEAAHRLPNLPPQHKCSRLHGHSFRIRIALRGEIDERLGWVLDFGEISEIVEPLIGRHLDHAYLNEVQGLENPTSENLARWLWQHLKPRLAALSEVTVMETCTAGCTYRGEDS